MKIRYLTLGLGVTAALALAVPAFATTDSRGGPDQIPARTGAVAVEQAREPAAGPSSAAALSFTVAYPTAAERARLAETGSVTLPVAVGGPGGVPLSDAGTISVSGDTAVGTETITAYGTAPDGSTELSQVPKNYERAIEPASVVATGPGTVGLALELTDSAKAKLADSGRLQVILAFSSPPAAHPALMMFVPLEAD